MLSHFWQKGKDICNLESTSSSLEMDAHTGCTQSGEKLAFQEGRNADGNLKKCPVPLRIQANCFHLAALHFQRTPELNSVCFFCFHLLQRCDCWLNISSTFEPFPSLSPPCHTSSPRGGPRESMEQIPQSRTGAVSRAWPWQTCSVWEFIPVSVLPRSSGAHLPKFHQHVWSLHQRATPHINMLLTHWLLLTQVCLGF